MKFLSNFDTNLESSLIKKYAELYGPQWIFVIHRAKIFWFIHCVIPTIGLCILIAFVLWLMNFDTWESVINNLINILWWLTIFWTLLFGWYTILKRYFDYKMDFCIVTTQEIVAYNQTGLLNRSSRTIDADKIKTVTENASWFIKSFFNFGDLIFLSEWDSSTGTGDISLNYVSNVNQVKNTVRNLIEPHLQKNNSHNNVLK